MTNFGRKKVRYSQTIKQQVIKRILSGELSMSGAAREYGIGGSMTITRWLDRKDQILRTNPSDMDNESQGETKSFEELQAEVASLQQLLAYERLRSEGYLTMIKLAEEKYKLPIEKKSGTKQSNK